MPRDCPATRRFTTSCFGYLPLWEVMAMSNKLWIGIAIVVMAVIALVLLYGGGGGGGGGTPGGGY